MPELKQETTAGKSTPKVIPMLGTTKTESAAPKPSSPTAKESGVPTKTDIPKVFPDTGKKETAPEKPDVPKQSTTTDGKKPEKADKSGTSQISSGTEEKGSEPKTTSAPDKKEPEPKTKPAPDKKEPDKPAKADTPKSTPASKEKSTTQGKPGAEKISPSAEKDTTASAKDTAVDAPKGLVVTQVFADRLEKPDEKALKSLPIPKEGEGFSMRLHPAYFFQFLDHPFSVNREVADYKDLYDSIEMNGINEPVKARPRKGGGLELISGHRRHDIASQLNYPVPVVIVQEDDNTAQIEVVDGNLHRQDIPTSELARAAKMKMEALTRKAGRRSKMEKLTAPQKRTDQIVAEDMGMSRNQVNRLIRIDALVPELKQKVDDKKLPFNTAVELSYLTTEEQGKVVSYMETEQVIPSMAQATALKEASRDAAKQPKGQEKTAAPKTAQPAAKQAGPVDERKISSIIKPKADPEIKYTFTSTELKEYFPDGAPTVSEVKRKVFEALDLQKKAMERAKAKQAIKNAAKVK